MLGISVTLIKKDSPQGRGVRQAIMLCFALIQAQGLLWMD